MNLFSSKKPYAVRRPKRRRPKDFDPKSLLRLGQFILAALAIYTLASLFALGTGPLGENISSKLVGVFGVGIVLPLVHLLYQLICAAAGRKVDRSLRQWLGTIFAYLAITLLLTLLYREGIGQQVGLLSPGAVGKAMVSLFRSTIGALGATLAGLLLVVAAFCQYGHLSTDRVNRFRTALGSLSLRRLKSLVEDEAAEDDSSQLSVPSVTVSDPVVQDEPAEDEVDFPRSIDEEHEPSLPDVSETEAEGPDEIPQVPLPSRRGFFAALFHRRAKVDVEAVKRAMNPSHDRPIDMSDVGLEGNEPPAEPDVSEPVSFPNVFPNVEEEPLNVESEEPQPEKTASEVRRDEPFGFAHSGAGANGGRALEVGRDVMAVSGKSWKRDGASGDALHETPPTPQVVLDADAPIIGTGALKTSQPAGDEEAASAGAFPPPLDLLGPSSPGVSASENSAALDQGSDVIEALSNFGVEATLAHTIVGPTVIQYQIQLAPGIKVSKVSALEADIAVALAVPAIRVEAPVPGTTYVGIELPNPRRRTVPLRTVLESEAFQKTKLSLPLPLGQTVDGRILITGLEELPHLLVAGTTGSGKSIFINNCITALCYHNKPSDLRFIMVDPKRVEMAFYEHLPHILSKPIVTPQSAVDALGWAVREMENRYETFSAARARHLESYNSKVLPKDRLPHIVIIVDELADLMMTAQKEVEEYIARLAQMARATGIHLILATQRPSVNVITGTIKANIPARVAFSLPSVADSRTILDVSGAQHLLGKGDMLFISSRHPRPLRIQSPFMDEATNIRVVDYLRNAFGEPEYVELGEQGGSSSGPSENGAFLDEPRLAEAVAIVLGTGIASSSRLQRQMRVGFTRAARMIDSMELLGIVGPADGSKPREILVDEVEADEILNRHGIR